MKHNLQLLVSDAKDITIGTTTITIIFRPNQPSSSSSSSSTELCHFFPTARIAFLGVICTFDLDESDLESESREPNDDEKRISEKPREDVSFAVNLASVHLVEKGHLVEESTLAR